jgi:hypothetical protein
MLMPHLLQEHNRLEVLPSRFWQMYSLCQLWLGHNALPALPDQFASLTSLALLHVEANQLKVGEKGWEQLMVILWPRCTCVFVRRGVSDEGCT